MTRHERKAWTRHKMAGKHRREQRFAVGPGAGSHYSSISLRAVEGYAKRNRVTINPRPERTEA